MRSWRRGLASSAAFVCRSPENAFADPLSAPPSPKSTLKYAAVHRRQRHVHNTEDGEKRQRFPMIRPRPEGKRTTNTPTWYSSGLLIIINTLNGLYTFTPLSFGIHSAPAIFQQIMNSVLSGTQKVICYLNDIFLAGEDEKKRLLLNNLTDTRSYQGLPQGLK